MEDVLLDILFLVTVSYMALVIYVCDYMRREHNPEWKNLGSPTLSNNSIGAGVRLVSYFMFSSSARRLKDDYLSNLVLVIRALFYIFFTLFLVKIVVGFN
jgi:hypothetical protein